MSEQTKPEADGFPPNGVEVLVRVSRRKGNRWLVASYWRPHPKHHHGPAGWGLDGDDLMDDVLYWEPLPVPRAGT